MSKAPTTPARRIPACPTSAALPRARRYSGSPGAAYNDSAFVPADTRTFVMTAEDGSLAAHPSYVLQTANGMVLTGDSFGDGEGRGWASAFDDASAKLKWAWQSNSKEMDAILGAATLADGTVVLGGTRSVRGRWELLLVALHPENGTEKWATTLSPASPHHGDCAQTSAANCFGTIFWLDADPVRQVMILGGVVDFPGDAGQILWKSGGGQPDAGGVPFIAAIPFAKLASATAPTVGDIATAHYFDPAPGFTTVVSLRAEHGTGVVALLPLNPAGGSVAHFSYEDGASGQLRLDWMTALSVNHQITDVAVVGAANASSKGCRGYVVSSTVNPGAVIEALTPEGKSAWTHTFDIKDQFPAESKRNWCQECWSIAARGDQVMLSCGVAELPPGDLNCDDGLWRSLLVSFDFRRPADDAAVSYRVFGEDGNFAVEYASFGGDGEVLCAIDADPATIIRFEA